jgi:glycerophosphoryl diester phosphodiesterase
MASNSFIAQCNQAWLPVYIWTVNQQQTMESCLKMGASGIITDKPKDARKVVNAFIRESMQ